ncbi:hypothetical protein Goe24_01710 [Bacillus phage vB_BsuM-Goe24]|uniref:Uncharacterized protein n=1 Tax=Bacillus phage vB_BsuM-Goe3 TaxID=1933063 RepID=A0A217ERA5_BPGO3|nr:hypothetical protein HWB07_gp140 [Bacillus phage vB_BsuM-Goe3]APZ82630.1 hypothetical protein Goe3_c16900 [Bacillus phage vB_BsuM-Goe3]QDP43197.1 hypothetical protein Goe7_c01720 [Bacillus phage vB_BveM-Goe7]WCS69546.1 hypothetical protein Goe24_01710 [Bacillus phage vB_BsuM-Goe24]
MGVKTKAYKLDKRLTAIAEYRKLIDEIEWDVDFTETPTHPRLKIGDMFVHGGRVYVVASALTSLSTEKFAGAIRVSSPAIGQSLDSDHRVFTVDEVLESTALGSVVPYYEQLVESLSVIDVARERIEECQEEIDMLENDIENQLSVNVEMLTKRMLPIE